MLQGEFISIASLLPFLNKEITLDNFNFLEKMPKVIAKFTNVKSTGVSTKEESLIKYHISRRIR